MHNRLIYISLGPVKLQQLFSDFIQRLSPRHQMQAHYLESEITGLFDKLNANKSSERDSKLGWMTELIKDIKSNFESIMNNHLADLNAMVVASSVNDNNNNQEFYNINQNQIYKDPLGLRL